MPPMQREQFLASLSQQEREIVKEAEHREKMAILFCTLLTAGPIAYWAHSIKAPMSRRITTVSIGAILGSGIGLSIGALGATSYIQKQPGGNTLLQKLQKAVIEERVSEMSESQQRRFREMQQQQGLPASDAQLDGGLRGDSAGQDQAMSPVERLRKPRSRWDEIRNKALSTSSDKSNADQESSDSYFFSPDDSELSQPERRDNYKYMQDDDSEQQDQTVQQYDPSRFPPKEASQEKFDRLIDEQRRSTGAATYERHEK